MPLSKFVVRKPVMKGNVFDYAAELLWVEIHKGIKDLALNLLGVSTYIQLLYIFIYSSCMLFKENLLSTSWTNLLHIL